MSDVHPNTYTPCTHAQGAVIKKVKKGNLYENRKAFFASLPDDTADPVKFAKKKRKASKKDKKEKKKLKKVKVASEEDSDDVVQEVPPPKKDDEEEEEVKEEGKEEEDEEEGKEEEDEDEEEEEEGGEGDEDDDEEEDEDEDEEEEEESAPNANKATKRSAPKPVDESAPPKKPIKPSTPKKASKPTAAPKVVPKAAALKAVKAATLKAAASKAVATPGKSTFLSKSRTRLTFNREKFEHKLFRDVDPKVETCRGWCERTVQTFMNRCRQRQLVKCMGNWGNDTQFAWVELLSVSPLQSVTDVLNRDTEVRLGKLGMKGANKKEYIDEWCDGDEKKMVTHITFITHTLSFKVSARVMPRP